MTAEELEYELRLTRQLRKLAEHCIDVAEEIRRGGAPWAGSLSLDARRLLSSTEYYEQDRRRAAAEIARPRESAVPRRLPAPDAAALELIR